MIAATSMGRMAGSRRILFALAGLAFALTTGCVHEDLHRSGFLEDYSQMVRDADRVDSESWRDPKTDFRDYRKVIIMEPVLYYSEKALDKRLSAELSARLIQETRAMLTETLSPRFTVVTQPSSDALTVRVAITEIIPTGAQQAGLSLNDQVPISFEDSHMEAEALNSMTAARVMAIVDTRRGRDLPTVGYTIRWDSVRSTLRSWSRDVETQLRPK